MSEVLYECPMPTRYEYILYEHRSLQALKEYWKSLKYNKFCGYVGTSKYFKINNVSLSKFLNIIEFYIGEVKNESIEWDSKESYNKEAINYLSKSYWRNR